jgi:hypothetical protein
VGEQPPAGDVRAIAGADGKAAPARHAAEARIPPVHLAAQPLEYLCLVGKRLRPVLEAIHQPLVGLGAGRRRGGLNRSGFLCVGR